MKEEVLHHLFRSKQLGQEFVTTDGRSVFIRDFGKYNYDAGPDFEHCLVDFDNQTWAGSVEFHLCSSDWYQHGHQKDPAYENVILHLVLHHDRDVWIGSEKIPTVELSGAIKKLNSGFARQKARHTKIIPCQRQIDDSVRSLILEEVGCRADARLARKAAVLLEKMRVGENLQQVFYQSLAATLGGKVNADPMVQLMNRVNLKQAARFVDPSHSVPALIFGLSGLLAGSEEDSYPRDLWREYCFLTAKYQLKSLHPVVWKFSRMHPPGQPFPRLAMLAELIAVPITPARIFESADTLKATQEIFVRRLPEFWETHWNFRETTSRGVRNISQGLSNQIIINSVTPFMTAASIFLGQKRLAQQALGLLRQVPPESNAILRAWRRLDIIPENAFESQGLIELKNEFCSKKKCLFCKAGTYLTKYESLSENNPFF